VILLDTHVALWTVTQPDRLSREAARAITAAERSDGVALASISLWELANLIHADRVRTDTSAERFLSTLVAKPSLAVLEITPEIATLATQFPDSFPGDPADRLIGATARAHGVALVTRDRRLRESPLLRTIW
jgi:PIN domain nuclease of toxin-antitoxin system